MQIGFDAKRLFLNDRGLGNYARNLLNGLLKYYPHEFYHLYTPELSKEHIAPNILATDNIEIHVPQGFLNNLSKSAWRSLNLGKVTIQDRLNVFHGLSQELPKDIGKSNAKSVVTIHDMIFLKHPEFYKPIDRWIYFNKVKFAVHNADHIIAISNQTKDDLINTFNLNENKISVIYQSCNEVFYTKRPNEELEVVKKKWSLPDQFLLHVGALNENKNAMVILEAMNRLRGKLDIPLVVVGNGEHYKAKLKEYAGKNGLECQLIFASEKANPSPHELSSFYQLASAFLFPSFYEGFGIPILEARFSGTPVIASNSSCLEEAGEQDTYYFDPNDSEELSELILKTMDNKAGPQVSEQFTLKGSTDMIYQLYNSIK